jgi:riboflavin kinase/FMN adenylyltransferase
VVSYGGRNVLIDTSPDLRQQALRLGLKRVDAILYTHAHADHIMGLDDVRPFNFVQREGIPIYASAASMEIIQRSFPYIFDSRPTESSKPKIIPHLFADGPISLFGLDFIPVRLAHGKGVSYGFRFGNAAYLTDHSDIPDESVAKLQNLDVLFLDALRHKPHPTHTTLARAVEWVAQLKPRRAFLTHICHDLAHARTEELLPPNVRLAYDGLEILVESGPTSELRVFQNLKEVPPDFGPCAITIGNFDGLHVGHRRIMQRVVEVAREHGWQPSALTFEPHPAKIVAPERAPKLLSTTEQRVQYMAEEGIRQVLILPFTRELSQLSPEEFVSRILHDRLQAKAVLVGDNFRFGYRHSGDVRLLRELGTRYGFVTEIVTAIRLRGRTVSSSETRRLIEAGDVVAAGRLLGRPYGLEGQVVSGHGVGKKQTVPTLNIATAAEVLPHTGVYVTSARDLDSDRRWDSVTNVGYRPTFGGDDKISIETYLLSEYDGVEPRPIRVDFLHRLRDEKKFDSPEALKSQIMTDVKHTLAWYRRARRWAPGAGVCVSR